MIGQADRGGYFRDYHEAYDAAVLYAREVNHDVGIEVWKSPLTPGMNFRIFLLPRPENCFGFEARAERVKPTDPRCVR